MIFAVRKKRNDSDFERNQAIFAVRKKRNDSDFKQNQAIFAVRKREMVVILSKISKFSQMGWRLFGKSDVQNGENGLIFTLT